MENNKHICKFEKLRLEITPRLFDAGTQSLYYAFQYFQMKKRKQLKTKKVLQCRTCNKYAFECPYCHNMVESKKYPTRITCSSCNKEFQIRWKVVPWDK